MENVASKEFSESKEIERKGLGTPAIRAATIEKLVKSGFIERKITKNTMKSLK